MEADQVQGTAAAMETLSVESVTLKRSVFVRLATRKDVAFIVKLVRELADYEKLRAECVATEEGLEESLFNLPPFQGPTVLMLETSVPGSAMHSALPACNLSRLLVEPQESAILSQELLPARAGEQNIDQTVDEMEQSGAQPWSLPQGAIKGASGAQFKMEVREVTLRHEINDPDMETYKSTAGTDRIIVGFVLFFPNYSTFLAKAGYYIEDLYVREPYRGHGYGTILLKTVAQQAVKRGAEKVEWCVLGWNESAIKFYKRLGALVMPEWRMCRLSGLALQKSCEHLAEQQPLHCDSIQALHLAYKENPTPIRGHRVYDKDAQNAHPIIFHDVPKTKEEEEKE